MPRYIDADALKQRIMNNWYTASEISDDIDAEPTADVVEVKHGKWTEKHHSYSDEEYVIEEWQSCRCSECGRYDTKPYMYYFIEPKFCSYCGAKMDGKETANEKD